MNFITISCNVCLLTSYYFNVEKDCIECDDHFEHNPTTVKGPTVRREYASLFQFFSTVGLDHCKLTGLVLMVSDFVELFIYFFIYFLVKSSFSSSDDRLNLCRSNANNHICSEFISVTVMPCSANTIFQSFPTSCSNIFF